MSEDYYELRKCFWQTRRTTAFGEATFTTAGIVIVLDDNVNNDESAEQNGSVQDDDDDYEFDPSDWARNEVLEPTVWGTNHPERARTNRALWTEEEIEYVGAYCAEEKLINEL